MEQARSLLNHAGPFDVALLDKVVAVSQNPSDPTRQGAHQLLIEMQQDPDMWKRVDAILEQSANPATRFFGLQILEDTIKTKQARMMNTAGVTTCLPADMRALMP